MKTDKPPTYVRTVKDLDFSIDGVLRPWNFIRAGTLGEVVAYYPNKMYAVRIPGHTDMLVGRSEVRELSPLEQLAMQAE